MRTGSVAAPRRDPARTPASIAAGSAIATDVGYVVIILGQGDVEVGRVVGIASCILVAAVAAWAGSRGGRSAEVRLPLLSGAAGCLVSLGVLGLFSIGLPLFAGGVLAAVAWMRVAGPTGNPIRRSSGRSMLALLAGLLLPIAAVALT